MALAVMLSKSCILATALIAACHSLPASDGDGLIDAPNAVVVSPLLSTSGQSAAAALSLPGANRFHAVVNLSLPVALSAVADEATIVASQGLVYVNIPIQADAPTEADFESVEFVLAGLSRHKVLVHCRINGVASSMVFLYRVIHDNEDPYMAYEALTQAWTPNTTWKQMINGLLAKHAIQFEAY